MSSTATEPPLTLPTTLPSVSVEPTQASSSGLSFGSGSELPPQTSTSSESLPAPSPPMSSPTQSGSPAVTSLTNPTPSPSPLPPSVPPSSTNPPMSSATTPQATSQPPVTSQPPSPTSSDPPSVSPPSTSDPPSATSQPPSSSEPPSTSTPPGTTSRPPSTTSTPPPETTTESSGTTATLRSTGQSSRLMPASTFSSTVFVTTTDKHGSTTLSAPSAFTSMFVSTDSSGKPVTVTQIISNPTLIPDGGHGNASAFFQNKGAVAGVFVVVGLAATAVVFSIFFWFRRRRRTRRLDHDTAVAVTLAEHGYRRQNLIDGDDDHLVSDPRTTSTPSGSTADLRRASTPSMTLSTGPVSVGVHGWQPYNPHYLADSLGQTHNPYAVNQASYLNASPGPSNPGGMPSFGLPFYGHGTKESMGSSEPLLGVTSGGDTPPEHPTPAGPAIPPRNPMRLLGDTGNSHGDGNGRGDGGISKDGSGGYEDDDTEYEAFKKRSLKVRNNPV